MDALQSLVQKSLVRQVADDRFDLLVSVQEYAAEHLHTANIPLGFLAVILGSLFYRDKRADDMWEELYARQNTGILASKAAAH